MDTAQSAHDELGKMVSQYRHPGLKVALSGLGVGAVLWLILVALVNLWDDRPFGLTLVVLLLALAISITAIIMLPIGLLNMKKRVSVYEKGFSYPSKKGPGIVRWADIAELHRHASGPILPGLLGALFAAIGGTIIHYTVKHAGREDVVLSNQMVQGIDMLAGQIVTAANLKPHSENQWTRR